MAPLMRGPPFAFHDAPKSGARSAVHLLQETVPVSPLPEARDRLEDDDWRAHLADESCRRAPQ
eukprot:10962939-Alexandrium_andersonii.AAC.1